MNKKSYSVKKLADVAKAISEGDFYKETNLKLKGELKRLAKYIEETRKKLQYIDSPIKSTTKSFPEASMQLSDITRQTEEATHKIISLTEKILDDQNRLTEILKNLKKFVSNNIKKENREIKSIINDIQNINISNKEDLIDLLTALSFQDLTGQKIKKIISLVQDVETKILVLLVSFGLVDKKKRGEMVTELKDPSKPIDLKQDLVDDILAEFFE
ncbi:MAG TPA: protein phosphatase CheZ [Nitrospinota bacterium]|nr:protein phosphatase CheZ [Nitrospinota bacterium]